MSRTWQAQESNDGETWATLTPNHDNHHHGKPWAGMVKGDHNFPSLEDARAALYVHSMHVFTWRDYRIVERDTHGTVVATTPYR